MSWLRPNRPLTPCSINKPTPGPPSTFFLHLRVQIDGRCVSGSETTLSFSTRLHPTGFKQLKFASCASAVRIKHFVTNVSAEETETSVLLGSKQALGFMASPQPAAME